jgi:hypothetical protein
MKKTKTLPYCHLEHNNKRECPSQITNNAHIMSFAGLQQGNAVPMTVNS